jgi:hypothetical protein
MVVVAEVTEAKTVPVLVVKNTEFDDGVVEKPEPDITTVVPLAADAGVIVVIFVAAANAGNPSARIATNCMI